MEVKDFFHHVGKEDITDIKNKKKNILESERIEFNDYFISVYLYEIESKYYCYLSVSTLDNCRSNLLNKIFSDLTEAKEYYVDLFELANRGDLDEISQKLKERLK